MNMRRTRTKEDRKGFWKYDRRLIETIGDDLGAVAEQLIIFLISRARVVDGDVRLRDGSKVALRRGDCLFSVRTVSQRLQRSDSAVHRAFRKLIAAGELKVISAGRRLKRGRGTSPTVVTVARFEAYNFSGAEASYYFETQLGTEERKIQEEQSIKKEIVIKREREEERKVRHDANEALTSAQRSNDREDISATALLYQADAAWDVLRSYEDRIAPARNREAAIAAIQGAIAIHPGKALKRAALAYVCGCETQGVDASRTPPEQFYGWKYYERYIES